jgi:hypothetical protein
MNHEEYDHEEPRQRKGKLAPLSSTKGRGKETRRRPFTKRKGLERTYKPRNRYGS